MHGGGGHTPNYKRTMLFIDGTNFLARLGEAADVPLDAQYPSHTTLQVARHLLDSIARHDHSAVIHRRYWCGSYRGNDADRDRIATDLHRLQFEPVLLKAHKRKEKGVDMALAINLLVNAFHRNLDVGWLVAGDADYVQLVQEAKRYGCIINVMAFEKNGLAPSLKLASDEFVDLGALIDGNALNANPSFKTLFGTFQDEVTAAAAKRGKNGREPSQAVT